MSRRTYISNGTREAAQRRANRRFWTQVALNTTCMLLFTASLAGIAIFFLDHLG